MGRGLKSTISRASMPKAPRPALLQTDQCEAAAYLARKEAWDRRSTRLNSNQQCLRPWLSYGPLVGAGFECFSSDSAIAIQKSQ